MSRCRASKAVAKTVPTCRDDLAPGERQAVFRDVVPIVGGIAVETIDPMLDNLARQPSRLVAYL
jgi:hypothetical protein